MLNTINKEIKELFADKKIWIGILTVLIIIIIGTSYNRNKQDNAPPKLLRLGVINNDNSAYSDLLLTYFKSSETFSSLITVSMGESSVIKNAFAKGELDIYLEIPRDFAQNMMQLEHSPINVTLNIEDTTKAILFQNVLTSYEKYIAAVESNAVGLYEIMVRDGMDQELIDDTNKTVSIDMILTTLGKESFFSFQPVDKFPTTTLVQYYIMSILVMALLYSGLYVGYRVLQEMRQGTFTRLRTTKSSLYLFLSAKMVIIVIVLTLSTSMAIYAITRKSISGEGIFISFALSLFCVSLAVFLSAFFPTTQSFILVGNLLTFYFIVLGGGIIPIQFLPQNMLLLSKMTPNYYMIKGIINITQGQSSSANEIAIAFVLISALLYGVAVIRLERRSIIYDEV